MENTEKIVFLYDEKSIPDQIIEAAKAQTPSGFELVFCESKMVELSLIHISEPTRPY